MSRRRQTISNVKANKTQTKTAEVKKDTANKCSLSVGVFWPTVGFIALLVASLWAYWPTLVEMVGQWVNQPDYSHGFIVMPIAIFFLWLKRSRMPVAEICPSIWGVTLLLLACTLRVAAGALYLGPLDGWTIPIWVAGAVWLLFGWRVLLWSMPSIAFLWFMIPIPFQAESFLSVPLQTVATKLSTASLLMLGQPALAEGNTIWIGDHQLFIEEACSGLRIFVGIGALAFAFTLFSRWSWWQKVLVLVAVLPIAIIANVIRVVTTALLYQLVSSDAAMHFSHDLSGLIMIPIAAVLFWMFLVYLDRLFPEVQVVSAFDAGRLRTRSD
jgi:exosortase